MRWGLTWWGRFTVLVTVLLVLFLLFSRLYPYLAPDHKIMPADILVLEGSVPDYILDSAIRTFEAGKYKLLITTGTPVEWGHELVDYSNKAHVAAASLIKKGFDSAFLISVGSPEIKHNRTYNAALAFATYIKKEYPDYRRINLMSYGPHSRRSWLMFREALGPGYEVGIIAVESFYYNAHNWWKTSKGFREVMNELLGVIFVELFFTPDNQPEETQVADTLSTIKP